MKRLPQLSLTLIGAAWMATMALSGQAFAQAASGEAPEAPPVDGVELPEPPPEIQWEEIAKLPPPPGEDSQPGLGGVFAGAQGDFLLIAGGTHYPNEEARKENKRECRDDVYVLKRSAGDDGRHAYEWLPAGAKLPRALAYGASVSLPDDGGVLCLGGLEKTAARDECFVIRWNDAEQKVEVEEYPKLPRALACLSAARLGNTVYVAGGAGQFPGGRASNGFYALDLSAKGKKGFAWKTLPGWDGPGRIFPVLAGGRTEDGESLYLCGGRDPGNNPDFLTDLHKYDPVKKDWSILGDIVNPAGHPASVMAAPAFLVPPHHLVIVSGTDEPLVRLLEEHGRNLEMFDEREKAAREKFTKLLLEHYPGYTRAVMAYDLRVGEWIALEAFPGEACLTNPAVEWGGTVVIPGGETAPGKRSPVIWQAFVSKRAEKAE